MDLPDQVVLLDDHFPQHVMKGATGLNLQVLATLVDDLQDFGNQLCLRIRVALEDALVVPEDVALLIVLGLLEKNEAALYL